MQITELHTSDGHLAEIALEFAPGLNCIIGARGTCKSTIVETIRFLFNDDSKRVEQLLDDAAEAESEGLPHRGLIRATLKGGTAHLRLDDPDKGTVAIERDTTSGPRVYVDDVVVVDDPDLLSEIEIYSQGELQDIATSPAKSLALVDRPNKADIERKRKQINDVSREVATIGPQLREIREAIAGLEALIQEGIPVREQLDALRKDRPQMSAEMSELRSEHERMERLQERASDVLDSYRAARASLDSEFAHLREVCKGAADLRDSGISEFDEIAIALSKVSDATAILADALPDESMLNTHFKNAKERLAKAAEPYHAALREEEEVTDQLKQEDRLKEEAKKLERAESEMTAHRQRAAELESKREDSRRQLRQLREEIFSLRLAEVERINEDFGDVIVLSLRQGTQTSAYRQRLVGLLDRSRIRERSELCKDLAAAFPPDALISIVEEEDSAKLAKTLGRDAGQMIRLVSHLADNEDVYTLEREFPDDELDVTMYVDGAARPVSEMSKGQKATAILPLLLRTADYPLVLDQPEDDLDNRFVFRTLVKRIKELKAERQMIFVTHNANIPVIGGAERVIAMTMSGPEQAKLTGVGAVDEMREEIIELLEGGQEAFELRSRMYDIPES